MTNRRFFTDSIDAAAGRAVLGAEEAHHARDVLRMKAGDAVNIFDGEGKEFSGVIANLQKSFAEIDSIHETQPSAPESSLDLTQGSVVIPGDKFDLVVQKAVELGVKTFVPLTSARCEIKPAALERKIPRWERIALDAARQCGRATLMKIAEPMDVTRFVADHAEQETMRIFFSEREGGKLGLLTDPSKLVFVIGPKGGWDDEELAAARAAGFDIVTLGGRIMRAETASIALTAILQHRFGDIN
jgi:16S rRNA (uracil1498-N3)-methyltransferase